MKFIATVLVLALTACSVPGADEAGPPPVDYRPVIQDKLAVNVTDPSMLHDVSISQPQPGRVQFIPGWRVCVRYSFQTAPGVYTPVTTYAFFFVSGKLQKIVPEDAPCAGYAYAAWPEVSDLHDRIEDRIRHPVWAYGAYRDELHASDLHFAELSSKNKFDLHFPYKGGTHASLRITKIDGAYHVGFAVDPGQIECTRKECGSSLRFDGDPIRTVAFARTDISNKSSIDIVDDIHFLDRLKTSGRLIMVLPLTSNGSKEYVFDTAGLDLRKLDEATVPEPGAFAP